VAGCVNYKKESTTKTGRHDIAEILLKVALNTITQSIYRHAIVSARILLKYI